MGVPRPLWLDETGSYWQIAGGWGQIAQRQIITTPLYSYILFCASRLLGTSEIALRIPSVLAMAAAALVVFRVAGAMFSFEKAVIITIVFCAHPEVMLAATGARPYAFAVLAVALTLYCLVALRRSDSYILAVALGISSAAIVAFHLLFAVLLPFILIAFWIVKGAFSRKACLQLLVATCSFAIVAAAFVPRMMYIMRTRQEHSFAERPSIGLLVIAFTPVTALFAYSIVLSIAALRQSNVVKGTPDWRVWFWLCNGVAPVALLYLVSVATPMRVFVGRYTLVAVPALVLGWGFAMSVLESSVLRVAFVTLLLGMNIGAMVAWPHLGVNGYSWKTAIEVAEQDAVRDDSPVLVCSDYPEADYDPLPANPHIKDSRFFAMLSYYRLSIPVIGLPRSLNEVAKQRAQEFLESNPRRRFLAMGFVYSTDILKWLIAATQETHRVHDLGVYDGVRVLEFTPIESANVNTR